MSNLWNESFLEAQRQIGCTNYDGYIENFEEVILWAKNIFKQRCKEKKEKYKKYLKTEEWIKLREKIIKKSCNKCEDCGKDAECVHHISYDNLCNPLEEFDCVALCMICHMKRHGLCESYNKDNIFVGECYLCKRKKLILRVDSWSGFKLPNGKWERGSWRNFCEECILEWGWTPNREYNKCTNCFEEFIGWKNQSKCKECCGEHI